MNRFLLTAVALLAAAPASAATVFSDDFNAENGGNTALNYNGFASFDVGGNVDLVRNGDFNLSCVGNTGACIDLDGTNGAGTLTSKSSFGFNAGDTVRFSVDISGNQGRSAGSDSFRLGFIFGGNTTLTNYGFNFFGSDTVVFPTTTTSSISTGTAVSSDAPYATRSIFFTAGEAGTLRFSFGTDSADSLGPMADNARLDITPGMSAAVPEPATWAMLMMGFGLVGAGLRRRTAKIAFA